GRTSPPYQRANHSQSISVVNSSTKLLDQNRDSRTWIAAASSRPRGARCLALQRKPQSATVGSQFTLLPYRSCSPYVCLVVTTQPRKRATRTSRQRIPGRGSRPRTCAATHSDCKLPSSSFYS